MKRIFLHGFATNPQIWDSFDYDLAPLLNFTDLNKQTESLHDAIGGDQNVIVGWSMGGMIAINYAAQYPEQVKALVLVSTSPKFISSNDYPYGLSSAVLRLLEKRIKAEGISAFHRLITSQLTAPGLANVDQARALAELTELANIDLRNSLAKIKVPTLIIHGTRDEICLPKGAYYLQSNIINSELIMLEDVGHAPMLEVPAILKTHLRRFISQHDQ